MMPKKIVEMFAWIVTENDGGEGIPAIMTGIGPAPMIGADRERIESYREYAMEMATQMGLPIKLCKFSTMTVLEEPQTVKATGPVN